MKSLLFVSLMTLGGTLFGQVKPFALTDVMTGKTVSLSDYNNAKGLVIIFTSDTCPFDEYYVSRISLLSGAGLPVLLVNAGNKINENDQAMKARASEAGWGFPYLSDKQQTLAQDLGASKTPEAFLLKHSSNGFTVVYSGMIDDNPQVATDVGNDYLNNAIHALLSGSAIENPQTRPIGCSLRTR